MSGELRDTACVGGGSFGHRASDIVLPIQLISRIDDNDEDNDDGGDGDDGCDNGSTDSVVQPQ